VFCFLLIIESLCSVSFRSLIVFLFCFLLTIDSLCVLFPFDHWWSFCSVSFWSLIFFLMIKRKHSKGIQSKKTINNQKETEHKDYQWSKGLSIISLSFWSLLVYVFCFLLIIESLCSVSFWSLIIFAFWRKQNTNYQWSKGNNKQNINDQKEREQKDYQWSNGNKTQKINDQKETEQKDYQWSTFWSLIVFLLCFLLIIDSLFVLFPFDHW
jgi:Ca2+/H+ antiporter